MDVLAVERRDEGAIEPVHHFVGDLIRFVLEPLDRLDVRGAPLGRGLEQLPQKARRFLVAVRDRDEQIEELLFPGQ